MIHEIRLPNEALNNAFDNFEIKSRLIDKEKKLFDNLKLIILGLVHYARVIPCKKGNHELAFEFNRNDNEEPSPLMKIAFCYQNLMVFDISEGHADLVGELTLDLIEKSVMVNLISELLCGKIIQKAT